MRSPLVALVALAGVALWPAAAWAQLRTWTDSEGVVHVDGEGSPAPKRSRKHRQAPAPEAQAAPGAPVPSWRRPNVAPPGSGKRAAKGGKKSRWWERRSDAPPDEIDHAAEVYKIPAELIRAVIAVESDGNAGAVSHKGALGLMQLMPGTAGQMYVQDPVDPAQNVLGGTRYLRYLANMFGGDMMLTLAAYNAGPEAVRKYGGVPPFEETRGYVKRVMGYYFELKREGQRPRKLAAAGRKAARSGR